VDVLGLPLHSTLPDGWTPSGAIVVLRCIDPTGQRRTTAMYAGDVMAWEAAGMLHVATLDVDADLAEIRRVQAQPPAERTVADLLEERMKTSPELRAEVEKARAELARLREGTAES